MKLIQKILLFICFFMMIHKPEFVFIPHSNNTFFGVLGIFLYLIKGNSLHNKYGIKVKSSELIKPYIPALIFAIISVIINLSTDIYYVKNILTYYLCFWGWYFISYMFLIVYKKYDLNILIKYFTLSAFLHVVLSILMYYMPSIQQFLFSLLKLGDVAKDAIDRTMGVRLLGFGASFAGAGKVNGFILLLISLYISNRKMSNIEYITYICSFLIISLLGIMQSRTILVGMILGIFIIIFDLLKNTKKIFLYTFFIGIIFVFSTLIIPKIISNSKFDFQTIIEFGFGFFTEKEDSDAMRSLNGTISMYGILPDNLKTWLIGDAKWDNPNGFGYYMNTDIGYGRAIFYFGLMGLFSLLYFYYKTSRIITIEKRVFKVTPKLAFIAIIFYILILNLKGDCDLFFYLAPFYFCGSLFQNNKMFSQYA